MNKNTTTEKTTVNANDFYKQCTSSDKFYKQMFGYIATDGVMQVANDLECHWFINVVTSYFRHKNIVGENFQTWKLERVKNDRFKVTATDGNKNILITQNIPFSDFKHDELTFWCVDKTIMLPSEY